MARRLTKSLVFYFLMGLSANAWAANYYVATTGNDSNPGTEGSPFATIQKGIDSATAAGDQVFVGDGTYAQPKSIIGAYSGSSEATKNITNITQANPCVVTVVGHGYSNGDMVEIEGLTNHLTTGMQHLFNHWYTVANVTADTFELSGVDSTAFDPYVAGGTVSRIHPIRIRAVNNGQAIIDNSTVVTGWTGSSNKYTSSATTVDETLNVILWKNTDKQALIADTSAANVNSEGEYYYDKTTNVFTIYTTSNPNSQTYYAWNRHGDTNRVFWIRNGSYISLEGFYLKHCSDCIVVGGSNSTGTQPQTGPVNHILISNITSRFTTYHGAVYAIGSDDYKLSFITIDSVDFQDTDDRTGVGIDRNGYAIKAGGISNTSDVQYLVVSNSTLGNNYQHSLQFSNGITHGYFYKNRIFGYSLSSSGAAAGIRTGLGETNHLSDKDTQIFDNDIGGGIDGSGYSSGCSIFIQDDNSGTNVFRNKIHHNTWHGIYIFYSSGAQAPSNIRINTNLIYENKTAGIRSDNSYGGVNGNNWITNNDFYFNGEFPVSGVGAAISLPQAFSNGIRLENNIIYSTNAYLIYSSTASHLYPSDNNLFYSDVGYKFFFNGATYTSLAAWNAATTGVTAEGLDANSVTGDPLYANPSTYDFRIPSPTTPADSAGKNLSSTNPRDYDLEDRQIPFDIGAYNTQGNLIIFPQVTLSSYFPAATGTVSVSFTTSELTVNKDWKIVFTFPEDFVLDSGGSTVAQNFTHMDGTFTTSVVGQVVTITRNNDGTNSAPNTYTFDLTHVKNPSASGRTGKYSISLTNSSDAMQGESLLFQDSLITQLNPGAISGATINGAILQ